MKTLVTCWQEYREAVYPPQIPAVQEAECHQAFFAGALNAALILQSIAELPEDDAAAALEKLFREAQTICRLRSVILNLRTNQPPTTNSN